MYGKVFEQTGSFLKPMTDIIELNTEIFESLRTKQSDFMQEVVADSIEYAKGFRQPSADMDTFVGAQQAYWEGMRAKLKSNAQDSLELITNARGKVGDLIQGAWDVNVVAVTDVAVVADVDAVSNVASIAAVSDVANTAEPVKAPAKKKPTAKKAAPKAKAAKATAESGISE